jgi:ATP:ADP antiporter, AAA family
MIRSLGQSSTSSATLFALASATLMIAQQVAGKATRDAVFLSHYDVTDLPKMVILAAVLSMLAVILMSRLLVSFGPWRVIPFAFGISGIIFIGNWWAYLKAPAIVAVSLYLQIAIFGAVLISGFWSVVNERFDPHTAKHTIARVAAAATLGGVLGGLLAGQVAAALDLRSMLLVLGVLHFVCFITVRAIVESRRGTRGEQPSATMESRLQLLLTHRFLQLMGLLMVLVAIMAALVDYAFKSEAAARLASGEELVVFFGQFYAAVGVLTFLVQSVLGPPILKRYGIGITLAVMPAVLIGVGLVGIAAIGKLWSIVILRASQVALTNSFFRSAFELLYTPLPAPTKRPTKTIIDVASDRLGDVLGSGLLLLLLAVSPNLPTSVVIGIALSIAIVTLVVVRNLYRGYIGQLATNLRGGAISLSEADVIDATTRHTLAEASVASEREILMEKIQQMKRDRGADDAPITADDLDSRNSEVDSVEPQTLENEGTLVAGLLSANPTRIRHCLADPLLGTRLVPYLIPLLAIDEVAQDIRMELRWKAPQTIGTLTDALLDPDMPLLARQRIPSILEVTHNPRAVKGLFAGLDDDEFNVRYSCARALARMNERDPHMHISASDVFDVVEREVSVDRSVWESRNIEALVEVPLELIGTPMSGDPRIDYSMEQVFTLLSLILERDALMNSRHAVQSSDRNLRGTALEYLENVLPENVRRGLWPHFGEIARPNRLQRPAGDVTADLERFVGPKTRS